MVQVIVLPSSSNAPLRVGSTNQPFHVAPRVNYKMGRVRGRSRRERWGWEREKEGGEWRERKKQIKCRLLRDQLKAGPEIGNWEPTLLCLTHSVTVAHAQTVPLRHNPTNILWQLEPVIRYFAVKINYVQTLRCQHTKTTCTSFSVKLDDRK